MSITHRMAEVLSLTCGGQCCDPDNCNAFTHYTQAERIVAELRASGEIPPDEEWRAIPGYEGHYEVSDLGRVRSLKGPGEPRLMKTRIDNDGYLRVGNLSLNGVVRSGIVHQLVMLAFVGPPGEGMQIRHLDGVRTNSYLSNLAYGTALENSHDRWRHGTWNNANLTHCKNGHPFDEENTYIRSNGGRMCRACNRAAQKRHYDRSKQAEA